MTFGRQISKGLDVKKRYKIKQQAVRVKSSGHRQLDVRVSSILGLAISCDRWILSAISLAHAETVLRRIFYCRFRLVVSVGLDSESLNRRRDECDQKAITSGK